MARVRRVARTLAIIVAVGLPVLLVAWSAASWVRVAVDFPISDDWRALIRGDAGSFDPSYLFMRENDTLYPVGKLIDSIAQWTVGGSSITYQLLSMVLVLGLVLSLQWFLLNHVLGDKLRTALAFGFTVLSLGTFTYWGQANAGYQQAIPVVCLLAILALFMWPRSGPRMLAFGSFGLAAVAGFTIVSGAVAAVAAGVVMLFMARVSDASTRSRLRLVGAGTLVAGVISVVPQLLALFVLGSGDLQTPAVAHPFQLDYWLYILGIFAESAILNPRWQGLSFVLALLYATVVIALGVHLLYRVVTGRSDRRETELATVYITLTSAIGAYLLVIAAGRLEFERARFEDFDPFVAGYDRFYEWWVTIAWPWVAATFLFWAGYRLRERRLIAGVLVAGMASALVLVVVGSWVGRQFDYPRNYARVAAERAASSRCIAQAVVSGDPADCGPYPDWTGRQLIDATLYGDRIGASFVQTMDMPSSSTENDVLFRLSEENVASIAMHGLTATRQSDGGLHLVTSDGPVLDAEPGSWLTISTGQAGSMADCQVLELKAGVRYDTAAWARLDYAPRRSQDQDIEQVGPELSDDAWRQRLAWVGSGTPSDEDAWRTLSFVLLAEHGLVDSLVLYPASGAAELDLRDLTIDCKRSK